MAEDILNIPKATGMPTGAGKPDPNMPDSEQGPATPTAADGLPSSMVKQSDTLPQGGK